MEKIVIDVVATLEQKIGTKVVDAQKTTDPFTEKEIIIATLENGTKIMATAALKIMRTNGPLKD